MWPALFRGLNKGTYTHLFGQPRKKTDVKHLVSGLENLSQCSEFHPVQIFSLFWKMQELDWIILMASSRSEKT